MSERPESTDFYYIDDIFFNGSFDSNDTLLNSDVQDQVAPAQLNMTNASLVSAFESCEKNSPYTSNERILYASTGALLSFVMTVTNLLIFIIFVKDSLVARAPGHTIIVGMMVLSDILIGLIPLPGYLVYTICGGWPLSKFACDVWMTMDYLATNVSYLSITAVAFERFVAVFFVLKHKIWMTRKKQIKLVVSLWAFTAGRLLLQFPFWANVTNFRRNEAFGSCDHPLYHNVAMGLIQRSIALYIPVGLTFTFYAAIIYKLCRSTASKSSEKLICGNRQGRLSMPNGFDDSLTGLTPSKHQDENGPAHLCVKRPSNAMPLNKTYNVTYNKSFRIVSLVIVAFLLANLPWHIVENLRVTNRIVMKATDATYIATWILTYMNGLLNPPLYFFMNRYYRKAAIRFVKCQSGRSETWKEHQRRYTNYQLELKRQSTGVVVRRNTKILLDCEPSDHESDEHAHCTHLVTQYSENKY